MRKVTLKAYAKINICFDILSKNEESGLHDVDTVMQTIDLYDYVTLTRRSDHEVVVNVVGSNLVDSSATQAARLFMERFSTKGVSIEIQKRIPLRSGLGGSSADAAATLRGLALLYDVPFEQLDDIAKELGADVSFLLHGGLARATGRGDILEKLPPLPCYAVVVYTPYEGVSTAEAYAEYDKLSKKPFTVKTEDIVQNLRNGKSNRLLSTNCLLNPCLKLNSKIGEAMKELNGNKESPHVAMSGSGSSCYALLTDIESAFMLSDRAPEGMISGVYAFVGGY